MASVEERLNDIEKLQERTIVLLEGLGERVSSRIATTDERLARYSRTIWGNNGDPGMLTRLDRLERTAERSKWLIRSALGAIITLLVGGIWAILFG